MDNLKKEATQIIIEENLSKKISLGIINNFIKWRSNSSLLTLDELLIQLLFSHLKVSNNKLSNIELTELESLIAFVKDQKILEEENDL